MAPGAGAVSCFCSAALLPLLAVPQLSLSPVEQSQRCPWEQSRADATPGLAWPRVSCMGQIVPGAALGLAAAQSGVRPFSKAS